MRNARGVILVAATALVSTGCGTFLNFAGAVLPRDDGKELPEVYGGVQRDIAWFQELYVPEGIHQKPGESPVATTLGGLVFVGLCVADFAASSVADTLTLPVVLGIYRLRHPRSAGSDTAQATGPPNDAGRPTAPDRRGPSPVRQKAEGEPQNSPMNADPLR